MKRTFVVAALLPILFFELGRPAFATVAAETALKPAPAAAARTPGRLESRDNGDGRPGGLRPRRVQPPHGLPGGVRPRRSGPDGDRPGDSGRRRHVYEAPNGIQIVVDGQRSGHADFVARATMTAPDGESMTFDFADAGRFGPTVLFDNELLFGYRLSRSGQVTSVTFNDGERTVRSPRGGRSHREDHRAYLALAEALSERHSLDFLSEVEVALRAMHHDRAVPVQARDWIECALGITGYVASIWGLVGGCVVAGVPTLGASCILAILAHEVAVASAILSCFP